MTGVVSTMVQDSPHKIFIGGLPNYLNDDQVSWNKQDMDERIMYKRWGDQSLGLVDEVVLGLSTSRSRMRFD